MGELVSEHAHHDEITVSAGKEHAIAEATLLDEADPMMECERCLVVSEDAGFALVIALLCEHETQQHHHGFRRIALAPVISADRDAVLEPARTRISLVRADGTDSYRLAQTHAQQGTAS